MQGFLKTFGVDVFDTYAPVSQMTLFHVIYTLSICLSIFIEIMDMNVVFLNATLNECDYIDPRAGYPPVAKGMVLRLKNAL